MKNKLIGFGAALGIAATVGLMAQAQYFPPSGGGTGPTTNPVSIAQGGTGSATAPANSYFGNNTGGTAAPAYYTLPSGASITGSSPQIPIITGSQTAAGSSTLTFVSNQVRIGDNTHLGTIQLNDGANNNCTLEMHSGGSAGSFVFPSANGNTAQFLICQDNSNNTAWEPITGDITFTAAGVGTLVNTGTAGTYASPSSVTTDAQGRITSITAGSAGITGSGTSGQVSTWNGTSTQTGSNTLTFTSPTLTVGAASTTAGKTIVAGSGTTGLGSVTIAGGSATSSITMQGTTNATGLGSLVLASGSSAGNEPTITMYGKTSGNVILQTAAAAGSSIPMIMPTATWTGPTVAYTGATSQATATANIPVRNTSGVESFPAGLLGAADTLTVGVLNSTGGALVVAGNGAAGLNEIQIQGGVSGPNIIVSGPGSFGGNGSIIIEAATSTSAAPVINLLGGNASSSACTITVPVTSAGGTFTLPSGANVTEVTAQPGANGAFVTQSTAGVRATQSPNGSPLDVNAPTAEATSFAAVAGTTYSATGTITVTMPTAVGAQGKPITIFMPGTSVMTVNTTSAQTFGGSASGAKSFTSAAATPILVFCESDNVNWHYTPGL